jgi:hypothetical protein
LEVVSVVHDPRHPLAAHRLARRTLIACEGRATEPNYFQAIRRHLHLPEKTLIVLDNRGSSPKSLVARVVKEREKLVEKGEFAPAAGDTTWAVFDGDEHRRADPKGWKAAIELAAREDVRLAVSNPCFEFWFLLHFEEQFAPLDVAGAIARLKKHVPGYTKNANLFPDPLLPLTEAAIKRAERLDARARQEGTGRHANPSTGMAALVRHLLGL